MAMFNSYVSLPEGKWLSGFATGLHIPSYSRCWGSQSSYRGAAYRVLGPEGPLGCRFCVATTLLHKQVLSYHYRQMPGWILVIDSHLQLGLPHFATRFLPPSRAVGVAGLAGRRFSLAALHPPLVAASSTASPGDSGLGWGLFHGDGIMGEQ